MADMGTKEAAKLWGVTQDKKGSPYHIPRDYPNPFLK